jgi:hypothetical protein
MKSSSILKTLVLVALLSVVPFLGASAQWQPGDPLPEGLQYVDPPPESNGGSGAGGGLRTLTSWMWCTDNDAPGIHTGNVMDNVWPKLLELNKLDLYGPAGYYTPIKISYTAEPDVYYYCATIVTPIPIPSRFHYVGDTPLTPMTMKTMAVFMYPWWIYDYEEEIDTVVIEMPEEEEVEQYVIYEGICATGQELENGFLDYTSAEAALPFWLPAYPEAFVEATFDPPDEMYHDEIYTNVPEPGTWLSLVCGVPFMIGLRKRRLKKES